MIAETAPPTSSVPPEVAVVMPVFNGAPFVAQAVASVLRQEGVSLELVAHDDGSSDGTLAILQDLARQDARIRVATGSNEGPAASRNHCLARTRAPFVAFLDHDDVWPDGRLDRQLRRLRSSPDAIAILGETIMFEELDVRGHPVPTARLRRVRAGLLQAGLFRRSALDAIGPFDTGLRVADDFDLLLRLVESGRPIDIDDDVAVLYRLHPDQCTADLAATGRQTARVLASSLRRRREANGRREAGPNAPAAGENGR